MGLKFTVIIPTYNGGEYLKQCVQSVLAQSFTGFDLAVLDAGSTDGSLDWLHSLHEPRLKIYPAPHYLGIVENWARALEIPKGEYMTLVGDDDLLDPNYLEVMNALILKYPDAGLYHAHFRFIDRQGNLMRACGPLPERETAAGYISALFGRRRDTYGTGYLMCSERYHAVGGIPPHEKLLFADDALWISLMQDSYKATAAEECFSCRIRTSSTGASAPWHSWCNGMKSYIPFLKQVAAQDAEFAGALAEFGPSYFLHNSRAMYLVSIVQATKRNERADPSALDMLGEALSELAPHLVPELKSFDQSRQCRIRKFINRNFFARWAYNLFLYARHGEWRGRQVRR